MTEISVKEHKINQLIVEKNMAQRALTAQWRHWNFERGRLYYILENPTTRLYADEERFFLSFFSIDHIALYK